MDNIVYLKSELDLFNGVPIQLGIDASSFVEIHPLASLSETTPLEFYISGHGENYLDLSHTLLHLRIKVTKKNGDNLGADDDVAPINYILKTLFSECAVFLNDKQVASQVNYAYRSYLESLLLFSKSTQDSLLSSALFIKDTDGKHDEKKITSDNEGYKKRAIKCQLSKDIDLIGALHFDLINQPKLLINGVNLRIKLERNKDSFALMSESDNFKIKIQLANLYVRKIAISPSIILGQEKALEKGVIKMPIRRVDVKSFALSKGLQSTTIANAVIGQLPTRLILGFVSNTAYNGSIGKNPFNFENYNLNYLCVLNDSLMIPAKPYQPNFNNALYARSYLSLFTDLNRYHQSSNININYEEYKNGYTLYAIDLTPDLASNDSHMSVNRSGNLAIEIRFDAALSETVSLIVYAEYRNTIEIDKARGVVTDF